jgi:hypothetical protein
VTLAPGIVARTDAANASVKARGLRFSAAAAPATNKNAKTNAASRRLATRFPAYYAGHVAKIADPQFMKAIRDYWEKTEDLYKELSAVRMPAAKHKLPKKRGSLAR